MRVLKYLGPHKGVLLLVLLLLFVQAFCDLMLPTFTASLVDEGIQRAVVSGAEADFSYLAGIGAQMLAVTALGSAVSMLISFLASRTGASIGRDLRSRLFESVVGFSRAEVQRFSPASLITRSTNDVQQVQMICIILLRVVLYAPILAIGGVIMVLRTDVEMAWVAVLAVVLVFGIIVVLMSLAMPKFRIMQKLIDRVNLVAREALTGIPVIRAFNRQEHEEARFDRANRELMETQLFTNRVMAFMRPSTMLVMNAASCLIVWVGAGFVGQGSMQTGEMIAFITYTMVIVMGFLMLSMVFMMLPRADIAAQRIEEVLACEPSVVEQAASAQAGLAGPTTEPPAAPAPAVVGAQIAFDHVTFAYDRDSQPALQDVSFVAPAGKTTAIIGSTGSGKSTIARLIVRAHDVSQGAVTLDGEDVRSLPLVRLHEQVGYAPQRAFLFAGTVGKNIRYGAPDADDQEVWRALRIAQAQDFVEKIGGLDASVSQGGTNFSGGQRQRLAIARAVVLPARAFVFDDSFSALDYATDAALSRALAEELAGVSVIVIAQRIATVRHADRIVVLDEGRVVGTGAHEELLRTCATYREIARSQLSDEELENRGGAR